MLIITLLLTTIAVWYLCDPLLTAEQVSAESSESAEVLQLLEQKERCLQVLKDLELDYSTKKLSDDDYQVMRKDVSLDLGEVLRKLDACFDEQ